MPSSKNSPLRRYHSQKAQAKKRGIPWLIDFDDWWKVWRDSGKWSEYGKMRGQYCMARKGDVGPYSVDNVIIMEAGQNGSDALKGWGEKKRLREMQKVIADQTPVSYTAPVQTIPVEKLKVKEPVFLQNFPEKKENTWSWKSLLIETFPLLGYLLRG